MTTLELIDEYYNRLLIGWDKLRNLELQGQWNKAMYQYYLTLDKTYTRLCKAARIFPEAATPKPEGYAQSR